MNFAVLHSTKRSLERYCKRVQFAVSSADKPISPLAQNSRIENSYY